MKKTALTTLKIAVSVAIYAYIFGWMIDVTHLWQLVRGARLSLYIAAVLLYVLIQIASTYRWYILLRPLGLESSFSRILSYYFLGMFFNNFFPATIGGDVFRVYYLNRETRRLSGSAASVFLDRDIGLAGLLLVALVVAAAAGTSINGILLAPIFGLVAVLFAIANLAIFYRPTYNLLHRLLVLFKMKRADVRVENLFESFNCYRGEWRIATQALVISLLVQVGCAAVTALSASALSLQTKNGWVDYLVFIPTIGLITLLPVSLNGMGLREFSYIMLFRSVGVGDAQSAALAFLWFGVLVLTSLPGGLIYVLKGSPRVPTGKDDATASAGTDGRPEIIGFSALPDAVAEEGPVSSM
jgi:glycosyltransferase 2 family protein